MRTALLCLVVVVVGCKEKNANYCAGETNDLCSDAGDIDAQEKCSTTKPCTMGGVCDVDTGKCVTCLMDSDCPMSAPVCDEDANTCNKCTKHTDCPSNVCAPDGSCADESIVAYVNPAGSDTGSCTKAAPCATLTVAIGKGKQYTKLQANSTDSVVVDGKTAIILTEPGTTLTGTAPVIDLKNSANLTIYDLTIGNATGVGIQMLSASTLRLFGVSVKGNTGGPTAVGISVSAGTLEVQRSRISDNIGGGILVAAATKITIINNLIVNNGRGTGTGQSAIGGMSIANVTDTSSKITFNTIARNEIAAASALPAGSACQVANLDATGNIIYSNVRGSTNDNTTQANTNGCLMGNSFLSGPIAGDLGFNVAADPPVYKLLATSPPTVLDVGGTCPPVDFDDQARPFNNACDLGADEYRPAGQ